MLKIALIGAAGHIGSRILTEALDRGHQVSAIVRSPAKVALRHPRLQVSQGDVFETEALAALLRGHDVVVSATNPGREPGRSFPEGARSLVKATKAAGLQRLVCVGGAGSLEVAPGVRLIDSGAIPADWLWLVQAHVDALAVFKDSDVDWTYFSPAGEIAPGTRSAAFRLGGTSLVVGPDGKSRISTEDYALALVDELEQPRHIRRQFTVGY